MYIHMPKQNSIQPYINVKEMHIRTDIRVARQANDMLTSAQLIVLASPSSTPSCELYNNHNNHRSRLNFDRDLAGALNPQACQTKWPNPTCFKNGPTQHVVTLPEPKYFEWPIGISEHPNLWNLPQEHHVRPILQVDATPLVFEFASPPMCRFQ